MPSAVNQGLDNLQVLHEPKGSRQEGKEKLDEDFPVGQSG